MQGNRDYAIAYLEHSFEAEIGYFETLQEAMDFVSEDAVMLQHYDIPKEALCYVIVKRELGKNSFVNYSICENKSINGVQCLVINDKVEAD